MFQDELNRFRERMPSVDYCSLRVVDEQMDVLTVRRDVLQPIESWNSRGGMVTVHHRGGTGYAATPDLSAAGIERTAGFWIAVSHFFAAHSEDGWQRSTAKLGGKFRSCIGGAAAGTNGRRIGGRQAWSARVCDPVTNLRTPPSCA